MQTKQIKPQKRRRYGRVWFGGETKTWAKLGGQIGATLGLMVGLGLALWINWTYMNDPQSVFETRSHLALYLCPFLGLVFGGAAGVLVGVGAPKYNPHPNQGSWRYWQTIPRNKPAN